VSLLFLCFASLLVPHEETLILEPGRTDYLLLYPGAVRGTIVIDSLEGDWEVNRGVLRIARPPAESLAVRVRYMSLADTVLSPFRLNELAAGFESADSGRAGSKLAPAGELEVHGAKTFALSISDAGLSDVDQGLTVDAEGLLAGVQVQAHLTDEEGSFVPEGTTERIEEFDRIAVGLSQHNWELRLGDLDLSYPVAGYGSVERRLQGSIGNFSAGSVEATGAFGIEGTRRGHEVLATEDGKQGPYRIGARDSEQPVVAGSERVWLDGELLERGVERDYTIDYSTGEITFTNRTRVDAGSRIEVDYTYAGADYRSDNELAAVAVGPLEVFCYREADSRTHLFHVWSAEQQAILDTASGAQVSLPGGRYVGANQGSYVLEDGRYVWVGADAGDYDVSFTPVEAGAGDYTLDADSGFFRYVGPGSGDYLAEVVVLLPHREEVVGFSVSHEFGELDISAAALGSRSTPNLYNSDDFTFGHAHRVSAALVKERFEVRAAHMLATPHAWIPADGTDVEEADRWDMDSLATDFNTQSLKVGGRPFDSLWVEAEAGHLWTFEHAYRAGLTLSAPFIDGSADWLVHRRRAAVELHPRLGVFTPFLGARFESHDSTRSLEPLGGLAVSPAGTDLVLKVTLSSRMDERRNGSWRDTLYYRRLAGLADWDGDKLTASASAGVERLVDVEADSGWQAVYADLYLNYAPSSRIRLNGDFSQHISRSQTRIVEYVPVEPGTGEYTRDPQTGEYIPSEHGDYKRRTRTEEGDALALERTARMGADVALDFMRLWTNLEYQNLSAWGSFLASMRLTLFPNERLLNLVLEPGYRRQSFPIWGGAEERLEGWGGKAQLRSRVHPDYLVRLEGSFDTEDRSRDETPLRSHREWEVELAPIIDVWLRAEPRLGFGVLQALEPYYYPELGTIVVRRVWVGSDFGKRFGKLKLEIGALLTQRQPNVADLPYVIARDDPAGLHPAWHLEAERSLGKGLSVRLQYEGNLYPDERGLTNEFELSAGMYF